MIELKSFGGPAHSVHQARARKAAAELVTQTGIKQDDPTFIAIAHKVGMSDEEIARVFASPNYHAALSHFAPYLRGKALLTVLDLMMNSNNEDIRVKAANALWKFTDSIEGVEKPSESVTNINIVAALQESVLAAALLGRGKQNPYWKLDTTLSNSNNLDNSEENDR